MGADPGGPLQPLDEVPHRTGIIELGLLVPAGGPGQVNGRACLVLPAESGCGSISEFRS